MTIYYLHHFGYRSDFFDYRELFWFFGLLGGCLTLFYLSIPFEVHRNPPPIVPDQPEQRWREVIGGKMPVWMKPVWIRITLPIIFLLYLLGIAMYLGLR